MPIRPNKWLDEFTANTNLTGLQTEVRTFQLSNGEFWLAWRDFDSAAPADPAGTDIVGQRYDVLGNKIGGPVLLTGTTAYDEMAAEFAGIPGGDRFAMVYELQTTVNGVSTTRLTFEVHNRDGSLASGAVLATATTGSQAVHSPAIAVASATSGLVV